LSKKWQGIFLLPANHFQTFLEKMEDQMGFLDDLLKQATGGEPQQQQQQQSTGGLGDLISMAARNPQIIAAVVSLLSSRDNSVGGTGGLGGLVKVFQQKGMGDVMSSWISTGPNPPVSGSQITDVLGQDTLNQFATKAGVPHSQAGNILAGLLPSVINHVTPQGTLPQTDNLESTLGGLLSGLGS
jgi:uncharacterized protein YidB (DUF937 family)